MYHPLLAAVIIATLAGGCASSKPKPVEAPQASINVEQFSGTILSGPQPSFNANQQPQDALLVKVSVVAMDHVSADSAQPISSRVKLITVTQSGLPVVPVAELTRPARVVFGDETGKFIHDLQAAKASQTAEMQSIQAALPSGVTSVFRCDDPASAKPRGVAVAVTCSAQAGPNASPMLRYALVVQDQVAQKKEQNSKNNEESAAPSEESSADGAVTQRETVIMDDQPLSSGNAVFIAPFRFANSSAQAIAFVVEISKGSQDQAYVDVFQHTMETLKHSADSTSKRPDIGPLQADENSGYARALRAAGNPKSRRAAIVYLANQTDAPLCADVALASDDTILGTLVDRISKRLGAGPTTRPTQNLGWLLDLSAFELLSELQSNNTLPQELSAVLTIHCGEAGRHASSLEEIVKGLSGRQDFQNRLLAENLIYLEDSSPASRVRAYDWLRALGRAPAGYDPLGDNKQRREALDRAANPTTQQAQQ